MLISGTHGRALKRTQKQGGFPALRAAWTCTRPLASSATSTSFSEGKGFADVEVKNLKVHGHMSGDISAGDRVVIAATAKVVGDLKAP